MTTVFEHELQRAIILKLIHAPQLSFNELWQKQGESNLFAYHVNKLEEKGIIRKLETGHYTFTEEGRKISAFIEGATGEPAKFPTLTLLIVVRNGEKLLCQRRLKEPFYGLWGFVSGKINFGMNLFECATRDLKEETGLTCTQWKFKGMELLKTYEHDKIAFHHYIMVVEAEKYSGELTLKTHKAEHAWMTTTEYLAQTRRFPGTGMLEHMLDAKNPVMIEAERFLENGVFTTSKTMKIVQL